MQIGKKEYPVSVKNNKELEVTVPVDLPVHHLMFILLLLVTIMISLILVIIN